MPLINNTFHNQRQINHLFQYLGDEEPITVSIPVFAADLRNPAKVAEMPSIL